MRRGTAVVIVALASLSGRVAVACGGKIDPDSLGSGGAKVGALPADGAALPPLPPIAPAPPPPPPPPPRSTDAGPPLPPADYDCDASSGPDAYPPLACTCFPSAVGETIAHSCNICPWKPPDAGPDYEAGCLERPFMLHEAPDDSGAPLAHACSARCAQFSNAADCSYTGNEAPAKSCTCDRPEMALFAADECRGYKTWDLIQWADRCVVRCLGAPP